VIVGSLPSWYDEFVMLFYMNHACLCSVRFCKLLLMMHCSCELSYVVYLALEYDAFVEILFFCLAR
jgi:hypothetical protein